MLSTPSADSKVKRTCARRLFDEMPQERLKVYHRHMNRRMPKSGIDALPDKVLARVLSFLPVQEAVQTCVLARRWRHLWRSMPVLHIVFEDSPLSHKDVEHMNRFVNMFLFLRDRDAPLELCEFKIDGFDENEPHISLWIRQALLSQARSLNVTLSSDNPGFELDDMHLISKHLTTLELEFAELRDKFLDFSSCTVLKSLWMSGCNIRSDKISSQSLKKLTICGSWFEGISRTRISAPNLVWLELSDNTRTPLLENMPSVVKAFLRLSDYMGHEEFCGDSEDCILLKGLSMAESLELIAPYGELLFKRDLMWCPIFSKLKTLLLNEWCTVIDFEALIWFLEHTPVLEKLTLQLRPAPENWVESRGFYIPSKEPLASSKLKVVEIKCTEFDERVHQVLRMLSIYDEYIKQINIQWSGRRRSLCFSFQNNMDLAWC